MASDLLSLISNPTETLEIEYKGWISPSTPEGRAKIIKGCLALRNSGGGKMIFGVSSINDTLAPDFSPPYDVKKTFDSDQISQLVADHVVKKFEVKIDFVELQGIAFPVLTIDRGAREPSVSRKSITGNTKNERLLKEDAVYVRTLESNGSPSSAEMRRGDWERVLDVWFQNREADIGNFIRRHLTTDAIQSIKQIASESNPVQLLSGPLSTFILEEGDAHFSHEISERKIELPRHGAFEVVFVIPNGLEGVTANRKFLSLLSAANKDLWLPPLWIGNTDFDEPSISPFVKNDVWEALLVALSNEWMFRAIEFWRADPKGRFYCRRSYADDFRSSRPEVKPMTLLDPFVQMAHVAEAFVMGQAISSALGVTNRSMKLDFSFRWRQLSKRKLVPWLSKNASLRLQPIATDDSVSSNVYLPLDAAESSIHQYVNEATKPLFRAFEGYEFSQSIVEQRVNWVLADR